MQAAFSHTLKPCWCQTLQGNTEYITAYSSIWKHLFHHSVDMYCNSEFSVFIYLSDWKDYRFSIPTYSKTRCYYQHIGCLMETYASKACILQFNEHERPQAFFFFPFFLLANSLAEEWHLFQHMLTLGWQASSGTPPHASTALCMVPYVTTSWSAVLAFWQSLAALMTEPH